MILVIFTKISSAIDQSATLLSTLNPEFENLDPEE
jgi:hypothetical protein